MCPNMVPDLALVLQTEHGSVNRHCCAAHRRQGCCWLLGCCASLSLPRPGCCCCQRSLVCAASALQYWLLRLGRQQVHSLAGHCSLSLAANLLLHGQKGCLDAGGNVALRYF